MKKTIKKICSLKLQKGYTYIFTSSGIVSSKKFKKNILDSFQFTDPIYLFAIDKIHLVGE